MSSEQEQRKIPSDRRRTVVLCKWNLDEVLKNTSQRKILLAVDGSDHCKAAFDFYVDNLHRPDDILILCHTLELPPKPPVPFPDVGKYKEEWKAIIERHRNESKDLLGSYLEMWESAKGINCRPIILDGHKPGQVIIEEAVNENVDAVIIGARGLGKLRRTVLGSVSDFVVHHCPVPVTVVPPESWKHHYPHHS
ncbi:putative universal stress protein SSP1056 [Exaiptasia diaphana]|nr:putative universal stress protein SSP1056 [Exaiptasia diaphana]